MNWTLREQVLTILLIAAIGTILFKEVQLEMAAGRYANLEVKLVDQNEKAFTAIRRVFQKEMLEGSLPSRSATHKPLFFGDGDEGFVVDYGGELLRITNTTRETPNNFKKLVLVK